MQRKTRRSIEFATRILRSNDWQYRREEVTPFPQMPLVRNDISMNVGKTWGFGVSWHVLASEGGP